MHVAQPALRALRATVFAVVCVLVSAVVHVLAGGSAVRPGVLTAAVMLTWGGSSDDLLVHHGTGRRPKNLEAYDSYLRRRWAEGCINAELLHRELQALGYRGSGTTVRQYVRTWRAASPPTSPSPRPPTVRQATSWFLRNPANLDPEEHRQLQALTAASPELAALRLHVRHFAEMMVHRRGQKLEAWMNTVLGDDLPELRSFVTGLRRDHDAVTAGLTPPYNSGPVESHVNRTKMLKRQMYGRANPDLLRERILLAD